MDAGLARFRVYITSFRTTALGVVPIRCIRFERASSFGGDSRLFPSSRPRYGVCNVFSICFHRARLYGRTKKMTDEWIRVSAPARTSNIGAGFDVLGLALKEPFDTIEGRRIESGIVISEVSRPGSESIPMDSEKNSVGIAAKEVLRRCGADFGIELRIRKGIRPFSGIGSSGASAAGGAYVAHFLLRREVLSHRGRLLCSQGRGRHIRRVPCG